MSTAQPAFYTDELAQRAMPVRYRNIGNPFAFLNGIGIEHILEHIMRGQNIVDVAKTMNVGIGVLLSWFENEGHMQRVEEATRLSADGYMSEATSLLRNAKTEFELKKAKELASHGRFLASKLDKPKYGQDNSKVANATGVTFIMHMGNKTVTLATGDTNDNPYMPPPEIRTINGTFAILPSPFRPLADSREPDALGPFEDAPLDLELEAPPAYIKEHL